MRIMASFAAVGMAVATTGLLACGAEIDDGDGDGGLAGMQDASLLRDGGRDAGTDGDEMSVIDSDLDIEIPSFEGGLSETCDVAAMNNGAIGCDFVVATPSFYPYIAPPCFAIFIANASSKAATIQVSRDGTSYDPTSFGRVPISGVAESAWPRIPATGLPPGQVAVLFMSHDPASSNATPLVCPVSPAVSRSGGTAIFTGDNAATGTGRAWHLVTSVPVTMYDVLPYGGAASFLPSAELIIPTASWTNNYFGVVPYRGTGGSADPSPPQWGQVVASMDGTTVQVGANVSLPAGKNVAAAPTNALTTYSLNAGDVLQWQDSQEMSGTVLLSNNPIGFNGGLTYDCYKSKTSTGGGCDSAHQQIPPIQALGNEYVAAPYTTRMASLEPESIAYRLVGTVDGTSLTYDPPIPQAPSSLKAGEAVQFETTLAFRVSSPDAAHPFYLGQMMSGCFVAGGSRPGCSPASSNECYLGDEEFVNILPPAQFLSQYVFFTDPTYATTNLVFTRQKTATGFKEVELDCVGKLGGWQAVGTAGTYEVTEVDLVRANKPNGTCANGRQFAKSTGPFEVMVWGLDSAASYAYPAGGNVKLLNSVVVPAVAKP
jgi:IgGFc binding protein